MKLLSAALKVGAVALIASELWNIGDMRFWACILSWAVALLIVEQL